MIEFKMGDWRTNASLLGLIRILDHNKRDYEIISDGISFDEGILVGFEEDYFNYFSDTYEKDLPWYRIVSYEEELKKLMASNEDLDEEKLEALNKEIEIVKGYLRRNNYVKVYGLIKGAEDLEERVKSLNKISLKKKEKIEDRIDDIVLEMKKLAEIIEICNLPDAKKYMRAKGVIYSHINRGLDGVAFLNRNTKIVDVLEDYRDYFLSPLIEDLRVEDKSKYTYECFSCGSKIANLGSTTNINLLNSTGFDDKRKSSYTWNHMSDVLICHKCNFLYSMISGGFNYSPFEGIFINYSRNIKGLIEVNNEAKIRINAISEGDNKRAVSYRTIVAAVSRETIYDMEYEQNEIQIIRHKNENYSFNILSSEGIDIIKNSSKDLESLENTYYVDNKKYISIYDLILDRIFNNQNLFTLIHFLMVNKISEHSNIDGNYNFYNISRINNINYEILKGGLDMGDINMKNEIMASRENGEKLRQEYLNKGYENKLMGISYRLLNSLKTRNAENFIHNILNAYMYLRKPVPLNMTIALEDEEKLGLIGYAFLVGINGGGEYRGKKGDEENVEK